jgi:hypothetical protein
MRVNVGIFRLQSFKFSIFIFVFGIVQKKGDEKKLCGKVIGYVKVPKPEPGSGEETPFDALVGPDGVLAIQGDYSKNPDFDSFRNNLQQSLPRGLQEILKHILEDDEIKENIDKAKKVSLSIFPQKGSTMSDFFPVPAQLVPFQSEDILLSEDCDIFFLGEFSSIGSAHLFLTGFPILYQSKYKEQSELDKEREVDELLAEIGGEKPLIGAEEQGLAIHLEGDLSAFKGNLLELLDTQILPKIMYIIERDDFENFRAGINTFRRFMHTYPHQQDIEKMVSILRNISEKKHPNSNDSKNLTLLCRKMSALHHEEFEVLPEIQRELEMIN